jgi:hypothetical protein
MVSTSSREDLMKSLLAEVHELIKDKDNYKVINEKKTEQAEHVVR